MKCEDKNILQYLEGTATEEVEAHIRTCGACSAAVAELSLYRKVLPHYREGRRLLEDLEEHVKSFDDREVRDLPPRIEELLRRAGKEEPEVPMAMAAMPRDLARPKKRKEKSGEEKK